MSNVAKVIGYSIGYVLTALIVGGIILTILGFSVAWLLPMATAGAFTPGFFQVIAIVTLALIARLVVFSGK